MIDYPLSEVILTAFLVILCNASTLSEIEEFGNEKEKWLKKFLKLENGIPSHDIFRRVFTLINPVQMKLANVNFLMGRDASALLTCHYRSRGTSPHGYNGPLQRKKKRLGLLPSLSYQDHIHT